MTTTRTRRLHPPCDVRRCIRRCTRAHKQKLWASIGIPFLFQVILEKWELSLFNFSLLFFYAVTNSNEFISAWHAPRGVHLLNLPVKMQLLGERLPASDKQSLLLQVPTSLPLWIT